MSLASSKLVRALMSSIIAILSLLRAIQSLILTSIKDGIPVISVIIAALSFSIAMVRDVRGRISPSDAKISVMRA